MGKNLPKEEDRKSTWRERLNQVRHTLTLTNQEKVLIVCVLSSLLVGLTVKHYRELYRETHPAALAGPTPKPSLRAKDLYVIP